MFLNKMTPLSLLKLFYDISDPSFKFVNNADIHVFRRLVATSRAPQSMILSMLIGDLVKLGHQLTKYGRGCPGVAVLRAPVGTRSPEPPQKFGHRP